ncbi:DUF2169 domain-containing protein [Variovorax sp. UC122_21]|uniref:DUF2169 domain-containing protein n=1 Tax=Variovorax sp. UC122_21 TaxID=3374554 RepID=UPI0037568430
MRASPRPATWCARPASARSTCCIRSAPRCAAPDDEAYLQNHAPGFPPDVDWRHFNMAPRDQWLAAPLRGDEPFALENLHPEKPLLQGQLPGLRLRVFADYRLPGTAAAGGEAFKLKEVPMRLTTVWFFPRWSACC